MSTPAALLAWFDRHRRDLPWRQNTDPYRVWLSEIMLQQTRVETVIPYYHRFLERFPTVVQLAAAPLDEVLALWSGLGYYRRARQLHACAQAVAARGGFPRSAAELKELPGIGDYTAAAVASIAFGEVTPVLDGNVERVMARWLALEAAARSRAGKEALRAAAAELLDPARPGDSNQALMELGATTCLPQRPRCLLCPLSEGCRARQRGEPESFPRLERSRKTVAVGLSVAVVERGERVLVFRREESSSLLAGMWELPWVEAPPKAAAAGLAARYGGSWTLSDALGSVRHGITYRAITAEVCRAEVETAGEVREGPAGAWLTREEIAAIATSSLVAKCLALVGSGAVSAGKNSPVRRGRGRPRAS